MEVLVDDEHVLALAAVHDVARPEVVAVDPVVTGACEDRGLTSDLPTLIGSLVTALHRDADLNEAFRTRYLEPSLERSFEIFRRAQARGEIGADANLRQLSMILPAMCINEAIVFGREIDRAGVLSIVDDIVIPACAATLS